MHYAVKQNTDLAIRNCRRLTSRTHSTGNTITSHATFALVCIAAFFSFKDQDLQGQTVFVSLATKVSLWSHFCNLQLATINVQTVPYFINSRLHLKHTNSTEHSTSWQALLKKRGKPGKTQCSLPHSQQPSACPHPESAQASSRPTDFLNDHFNIMSHPCLGLESGLFPCDFPTKAQNLYTLHTVP